MCVYVFYVDLCLPPHSTSWWVLVCLGRSWDQILCGKFCFVSASVHTKAWGLCANDRNQHLENVAFWLAALNVIGVYVQEKLGSKFLMDVKTGLWSTALTRDPRGKRKASECHSVQCLAVLCRNSSSWCGALSNRSFLGFSFGTRLFHHYPVLLKSLCCSE